jgi:hypothetical protein
VNVSTKENPYGTSEGQDISSISENMWRRWYRLGKPRSASGSAAFTSTSAFSSATTIMDMTNPGNSFTANLGHELLIQKITLSSDQDAIVNLNIYPGIFNPYAGDSSIPQSAIYIQVALKAGVPWDWYPDGSISLVKGRANQVNSSQEAMSREGTITISSKAISNTNINNYEQWNALKPYAIGDYATNLNVLYIRKVAGTTSGAPASDSTNWAVVTLPSTFTGTGNTYYSINGIEIARGDL